MMLLHLALDTMILATAPMLLWAWNSILFRRAPELRPLTRPARQVSVLIPARNEEVSIAACVESVLASRDVELEVVVLDDHSEDRTAEIVRDIAKNDPRVRIEPAPPLPACWCGKQHACFALSKLARYPILTFLDADVRLAPDALARMTLFLEESHAALVSGFPRQETGTFLEKLLIPLINWLLLSFLPLWGMRHSRWSAFGAGCGQWFMTTRGAYEKVGGHAAVKSSMHDGLTLPRAYRRARLMTDICDATDIAVCRMYRSASAVWNGLAKNAREGMAATRQILAWTVLLLGTQVLPFAFLAVAIALTISDVVVSDGPLAQGIERVTRPTLFMMLGLACLYTLTPRLADAGRFRQSWLGAVLHPLGVLLLLAIQWYAVFRAVIGMPVGWKGRTASIHAS